jgi:hypothetical protein
MSRVRPWRTAIGASLKVPNTVATGYDCLTLKLPGHESHVLGFAGSHRTHDLPQHPDPLCPCLGPGTRPYTWCWCAWLSHFCFLGAFSRDYRSRHWPNSDHSQRCAWVPASFPMWLALTGRVLPWLIAVPSFGGPVKKDPTSRSLRITLNARRVYLAARCPNMAGSSFLCCPFQD